MSRRRTTLEWAQTTGAAIKNPARYSGRHAHTSLPRLGQPRERLTKDQKAVFLDLRDGLPWLRQSDRLITEMTAALICKLRDEAGVSLPLMRELRACLSAIGATPVDRQKVPPVDDDESQADPLAEFMQ